MRRAMGRAGSAPHRARRGPWLAAAAVAGAALVAPAAPARAATNFLELREQLEVERPKLREGLASFRRAPDVAAFPADEPGVAFGKYLKLVWSTLGARTAYPEVYAALRGFRGQVDATNAIQRQALGVLLGDYLQVRYGDDLRRELKRLVGFRTFDRTVERNPDNPEVRKCFDHLTSLATSLGLQAQNHGYETLQITLPAAGSGGTAPALAIYTHADVPRPIEHKWTSPPFELQERAGRWYGAGVYDDKGAILVNLFGMRVLRDAGARLARPVVLLVSSTGEDPGSGAAASVGRVAPRPALVLAADGEFPYATGEPGRLLARVSSARGMKTRAGIRPGQFYVHRMTAGQGTTTVPSEARFWVRYEPPLHDTNPALTMTNKFRGTIEAYQKTHSRSVYEIYIQEDTLHFFVYGTPAHVQHADKAVNSLYDGAGALQELSLYANSARDVLLWIHKGLEYGWTGKNLGLDVQDVDMGGTWVSPVGFDRLADEVAVLVDVRWPLGHDSAWVKQQMSAAIDAFDKQNGTRLQIGWEPGGSEPVRREPAPAVRAALAEAYVLASGESAPPVATTSSCAQLLPAAVPFGPEWPRGDAHGHTRDESISQRELQDLGVAYLAAMTALATGQLPAAP